METLTPTVIGVAAGVVGGLAAGAIVLLLALLQPQRACPDCGKVLPKFRVPTGLRQLLWGGWTCPACAAEMDSHGRKIARPSA